jgi:GMP synthase-like glutamine amidotransferase
MISRTIRIAVLNTDVPVPAVCAKLGSYGAIFHHLLSKAASRVSPTTTIESAEFDVVKGEYPERVADFDAILITGAAASAYDNADWIHSLDAFVWDLYHRHPSVRMFGSCFGHQLICQSLLKRYGVVVERDPKGWELGVQEIRLSPRFLAALGDPQESENRALRPPTPGMAEQDSAKDGHSLRLQFVHADHVNITSPELLPESFIVIGRTEHCAVQGIYEPARVLTYQGHFEFDKFVNSETAKVFGASWASQKLDEALASMDNEDDSYAAADMVIRFLLEEPADTQWGLITPPAESL